MKLPIISESSAEAIITAPVETIDLTDWVFNLTDRDYQACSKDHIAAAATVSPDGKRMSINVERVGVLLVQHYVEDLSERRHCRLVSVSNTFGPDIGDRGQLGVMWEFFVEPIDGTRTKFINRVQLTAVPGWEEALRRQGLTLEQVRAHARANLLPHNAEETPLFAKDIERKALEGRWSK